MKNGPVSYQNFLENSFQGAIALLKKLLLHMYSYNGRRVTVGIWRCNLRWAQV